MATTDVVAVSPRSFANPRANMSSSPARCAAEDMIVIDADSPADTSRAPRQSSLPSRASKLQRASRKNQAEEPKLQIPQSRITKPTGSLAKASAIETGTSLEIFDLTMESIPSNQEALDDRAFIYSATKRRLDWTPPKSSSSFRSIPPSVESLSSTTSSAATSSSTASIRNLLDKFQYESKDADKFKKPVSSLVLKKRRVDIVHTPSRQPTKPRSRKVSTQARPEAVAPEPVPIAEYFSKKTNAGADDQLMTKSGKPRAKRTNRKGKEESQLLSPESALKASSKQSFVFGTSSQLAQEQSPRVLRDLQLALDLSSEDPFHDPQYASNIDLSAATGRKTAQSKPNMWTAAARDSNGVLLELETVDLTSSPCDQTKKDASREINGVPPASEMPKSQLECETDTIGGDSYVPHDGELPPHRAGSSLALPVSLLPSTTSISTNMTNATKQSTMPNYSAYSTLQLSKELTSYNFKPIRGRLKMIALLEKCWESKLTLAASGGAQAENCRRVEEKSADASKRRRGRPAKQAAVQAASSTRQVDVVSSDAEPERADDDTLATTKPTTPVRARRRPTVKTPQLGSEISIAESIESSAESDGKAADGSTEELFRCITRAVMSAPRSDDPQRPSWYEKMLMYDPIVLEDLSTWLNTGALDRAGWDGEVWPGLVKQWCQSKSICCLWRDHMNGARRK